jgi:predicted Fe-Mo cluster-binding NifX family protein
MERSAANVADCQAVLVARIGECGIERLAERGIEAFEVSGPIETALRRLASGARPQPATCDGSPRDHAGSDHHP